MAIEQYSGFSLIRNSGDIGSLLPIIETGIRHSNIQKNETEKNRDDPVHRRGLE